MIALVFQSPSGMKGRLVGSMEKARMVVRKMREDGWEIMRILDEETERQAEELEIDDGW